nr:reverse transcriptase domain-containing protein [Tanacetum cinerariifolium]
EGVNRGVRGAPDFSTIIAQQLQNLLPAILAQDGNQGSVGSQNGNVDMSGCSINQKVKYTAGSFVGKALMLWNRVMVEAGHTAYTDRFHELARLVPHLVTPKSKKIERYVYGLALWIHGIVAATNPKTMQKAVQNSGALTDKAVRNGSIKKIEKKGNVEENSKDKNGRDDNKRTRTGNAFATTVNPDCRVVPRNVNSVNVRNLTPAHGACYECGSTDHLKPVYPRLNKAQGSGGNHPNQVVANNEGQGRGNQRNQARGIKPSNLGFSYEIKIDSVGSFDVIIRMDWLSDHKAEIIFHEKVVRIPLLDGKVLKVLGEKPKEKMRQLMSAKAKEKEQRRDSSSERFF